MAQPSSSTQADTVHVYTPNSNTRNRFPGAKGCIVQRAAALRPQPPRTLLPCRRIRMMRRVSGSRGWRKRSCLIHSTLDTGLTQHGAGLQPRSLRNPSCP
eukprot:2056987-Rhodomonas_salina.2